VTLVALGTEIKPYGRISAVGWVGERYYWLVNKRGDVSMIPASIIERDCTKNHALFADENGKPV